jgi:alcohol dehydrogenase YqhD (iron-dependent ADH family)
LKSALNQTIRYFCSYCVTRALENSQGREKAKTAAIYGQRVWNISNGSEEERAQAVINKTVNFFESPGVKIRLSNYDVTQETIDKIVARFENRKWTGLGDRGLTTPAITRKALEYQLKWLLFYQHSGWLYIYVCKFFP